MNYSIVNGNIRVSYFGTTYEYFAIFNGYFNFLSLKRSQFLTIFQISSFLPYPLQRGTSIHSEV